MLGLFNKCVSSVRARFVLQLNSLCVRISRLTARVRTQVGETVVEALAAVLICSFALLMLYTAVATAARINVAADTAANELRKDAIAVETQAPTGNYQQVRIVGFDETYEVEYYTGSLDGYVSYRLL